MRSRREPSKSHKKNTLKERIVNKVLKSHFFHSVIVLMTGSMLAALIRAVATPVLTRLYSQEAMGAYVYLISISSIFMGVVNARYDVPIVTDGKGEHVYPLIKLSLLVGVVVTSIATLVFTFVSVHNKYPFYWPFLFFFNVIAYSIVNVLTAYNNRSKEYKVISSVSVIRRGIQYGLAILLGLVSPYSICLLIPYVIGEYAGISRQLKPLRPHLREVFSVDSNQLKEMAKLHWKQTFFSTPALLANSLSYSLITVFIGILYGLSTVGLYSISMTLLGVPLGLIGGNVAKVFMQKASVEYANNGNYSHTFNRTFAFLAVIAVPMALILILFGEPLCSFIFGKQWAVSGVFIKILAPMFAVRFVTSALSPAFTIVKKQQLDLVLQLAFLASNLVSFFIAKSLGYGPNGFLTLISILFTISYSIYLFYIYYLGRKANC